MAEVLMVKRERSCSALHLFACFVVKSGANVSTGSQGGLRTLGISTKAPCEASAMHDRHGCKGIYDSVLHAFVRTIRALMVSARPKRPDGAGISV